MRSILAICIVSVVHKGVIIFVNSLFFFLGESTDLQVLLSSFSLFQKIISLVHVFNSGSDIDFVVIWVR